MSEFGRSDYGNTASPVYIHLPYYPKECICTPIAKILANAREINEKCPIHGRNIKSPSNYQDSEIIKEKMRGKIEEEYEPSFCTQHNREFATPKEFLDHLNSVEHYFAPSYYQVKDKDLYSIFIEKYGLEAWKKHVIMEAIQYLWRVLDRGSFKDDIEKVIIICERILKERSKNA